MKQGLTFIITAFNQEGFIEKTINSVLKIIGNNIFLIIIDDGSTDRTFEICSKFSSSFVSVYKIENHGVSFARNFGINHCKTTHISFVDGDDYLPDDLDASFFDKIISDPSDIFLYNYYVSKNNILTKKAFFTKDNSTYFRELSGLQLLEKLELSGFERAIWKNIYRVDLIQKHKLFFNPNLSMNEDGDWLFQYLLMVEKATVHTAPLYVYVDNPQAATKSGQTLKKMEDSLFVYSKWHRIFNDLGSKCKISMANGYINAASNICAIKDKKKKNIAFDIIRKQVDIIYDATNISGKLFRIFNAIFTLKQTMTLLYFCKCVKNRLTWKKK